jgi:hypothetical protein
MSAMTNPKLLEHLDGLRSLKGFPTNEDSAVSVVVRYFADRGVVCTRTRRASSWARCDFKAASIIFYCRHYA